jgi:hypothetical protein
VVGIDSQEAVVHGILRAAGTDGYVKYCEFTVHMKLVENNRNLRIAQENWRRTFLAHILL